MNALEGISIRSRVALLIAALIMFTFFGVQTCIVFGVCPNSYALALFGYICVICFMPPFFMVVYEFLQKKKETTDSLFQKNIYLEHAAKIIRHDMHSGINTYLPRGISSLLRRLDSDNIDKLKIAAPLRLIQDGLKHAQQVYAGVYEFTNLVKHEATLNISEEDIAKILREYLSLTAYVQQVILDESLPKNLNVNKALFCTAVDNLIRNGLKYNDSATKYVKIYSDSQYIFIEDNGRGITNEDFLEYSKPYTRKKDQKETGTGLGLNISTEILKEHGFSITAEKIKNGTVLKIKIK
jgi:K+-sensing histidine kinase KdpD